MNTMGRSADTLRPAGAGNDASQHSVGQGTIMGKLLGGLIGIGLVLLLVGAIAGQLQTRTALDYERERIEMEVLQHQADVEAFWLPVRAAALNMALIVAVFGLAAYVAALGVGQVVFFRQYAQPDARGLLPLLREDQDAARVALSDHHATELARASIAPVPHSYAPHTSYSIQLDDHRADRPGIPGDAALVAPALPAGLIDLAHLNFTPSITAVLLGLDPAGSPITVPMKDLWHIGTAGPTGSGKSNIARLIIAQLQCLGAKVAIIDPKWTPYDAESDEDWRPIAQRLFLPPARKAGDIGATIAYFHDELERRLDLRNAGLPVGAPLFLYADEFTTITSDVETAGERFARLGRLGRGVKIFLLIAAHDLLVKSGAGDTRDQLRTGYYLGGDAKTGSVLLDMPQRDVVTQEGHLRQGVAMLRSSATRPARLVRVPYASNAGIAAMLGVTPGPVAGPVAGPGAGPVGRALGFHVAAAPTGPDATRPGHGRDSGRDAASASGRAKPRFETDEARVLARFAAGASIHEITAEVAGTSNPGDRRYKAARIKLEALLRRVTEERL